MQTLHGMKVVESPLVTEVPNLQLSPGFDVCSDTMRDHMNSWLLAMFGSHMPCYVFQDTIIMHPRHAAMLRGNHTELLGYNPDYPWRPRIACSLIEWEE